MKDKDIVIISAARTPFGKMGGALKDVDCYDLGAIPMKAVLERITLPPDLVDEVWWGMGDSKRKNADSLESAFSLANLVNCDTRDDAPCWVQ